MILQAFLRGAIATGCVVAALFFLRFWRDTGDRLFAWFAGAFAILAIDYALLGLIPVADETQLYVFVVRVVAFLVILYGIYDKNRR